METIFRTLTGGPGDEETYCLAGEIIRAGGLVAFPTETVYGLGGNGLSASSSAKIYAAKGRPSDNPLILHIADIAELAPLVQEIPAAAKCLADAFWPGPMTLIFRKSSIVPDETTGGLDTVAVRMPSHPAAQAFIRAAGVPIAAPSANLSGRPSTTTAAHVREDLDGRIDMILDGGPSDIGLESTIIDLTGDVPVILRPGFIGRERLEKLLGEVDLDKTVLTKPTEDLRPKAPGMKYRHYAPKAEVTIVEGEGTPETVLAEAVRAVNEGKKTGIICSSETAPLYEEAAEKLREEGLSLRVFRAGSRHAPETVARRLFDLLRQLDAEGIETVWSEAFDEGELGMAIMNRLRKAAGYRILQAAPAEQKKEEKRMIAIGCDHGGYALKQEILQHLAKRGLETKDFGCYSEASCDYPVYAKAVAKAVAAGEAEKGILICGTGIGMSLAANKVRGIRAAAVSDCFTAEATRQHNDANVLCMGARTLGPGLALKIVDIFLDTPFSGDERHVRRIAQIED